MFRIFFTVILFIVVNATGQKVFLDNDKFDQYMQQLMDEWKIGGCAVGIVYRDSLVFSKGYGYRDVRNKLPVTRNTLFGLGSNTKLFTAVAASILHSESILSLDTPVNRYMPQLEFPTAELKEKVTIRDMLSHTNGVPRWDGVWFGARYNNKQLTEKVKYLKPTRKFREAFLYNNIYFSLAGIIASQRYGTTWQDLVRNKIFAPLQMKSSRFSLIQPDQNLEAGFDYISDPYSDSLKQLSNADYFCSCIEPSGSIFSNIEDLSHWVVALLNKGVYKKTQVIPTAAIEETSVINNSFFQRFKQNEIIDSGYGLGRAVASYKNHRFLYHGGSAGGYRTEVSLFPDDSIGIIVLTNTVQGTGMSVAAVFGIADRIFNMEKTEWSKKLLGEQNEIVSSRKKELDSIRILPRKPAGKSRDVREYTGIYENDLYGPITIVISNNVLNVRFRYVHEQLQHLDEDEFWTKEHPEYSIYPQLYPVFRLKFVTNHKGEIDRLRTSVINDPETEFERVKKR